MRDWWELMEHRGTRDDVPMKPQVVAWHLAEALADDAIVCGDSGQVTYWVHADAPAPGAAVLLQWHQLLDGGRAARTRSAPRTPIPDRQVVAFTGDGSLTMQMGDLATLIQEQLPVKVIVFKNNSLGLIKWEQMVFIGNPEYGVDFAPVDFVKVAEACGARAFHIEDPG